LVTFLHLAGCHRRGRSPEERGRGVFLRSCAGCHGPDGRGTLPPGFSVPARNLTDPVLQQSLSDAALRDTIRRGKGQMPAQGAALPEEDVTLLIGYVRTLARPR
jgi:mono/diheme cytochrome c family protein